MGRIFEKRKHKIFARNAKLSDEEFAVFGQVRDKTPARAVSFE